MNSVAVEGPMIMEDDYGGLGVRAGKASDMVLNACFVLLGPRISEVVCSSECARMVEAELHSGEPSISLWNDCSP